MAEVTAEKVRLVRERTDCGMEVAKRALFETDGDVSYAIIWVTDSSSHPRLRKLFSIGRKPRIRKVNGKWEWVANNCGNFNYIHKVKEFVYWLNMRANQCHAFYNVQGDNSEV